MFVFFNRMGEEEAETRTSNFSFQVLLKTHPEKLGGIRPFKIKTSFILLCVRWQMAQCMLVEMGQSTWKPVRRGQEKRQSEPHRIPKVRIFEVQCVHRTVDHCERRGRWTASSEEKRADL